MNKEIEQLKREETQRQTLQTLNMIELWLACGMLTLEIIRQHAANAPNE